MSRFYEALSRAGLMPGQGERPQAAESSPEVDFSKLAPLSAVNGGAKHNAPADSDEALLTMLEEPEASDGFGEDAAEIVPIRIAPDLPLLPNALDDGIVEHYRMIRTQILRRYEQKTFRRLLITSAGPQEGKTVTALNLAFTFGKIPFFKVLIVDGDLRRGNAGASLGLPERPGFGNLLDGTATLEQVIVRANDLPIDIICRGTSRLSPAELLHSPKRNSYLRLLAERYSIIFIDCPPVNVVEDTQLLAESCDGVLLVTRFLSTSCKELTDAIKTLSPYPIVGTILNGGSVGGKKRYAYYYSGGEPAQVSG